MVVGVRLLLLLGGVASGAINGTGGDCDVRCDGGSGGGDGRGDDDDVSMLGVRDPASADLTGAPSEGDGESTGG